MKSINNKIILFVKNYFKESDLIATVILSSICIIFIFNDVNNIIFNNLIYLILFYISPGYILITFIYPKKNDINIIKRFVLFLISSIVIFTLLGISILYFSSLNKYILAMVNYLFILIFSLGVFIKRKNLSLEEKFTIKNDVILLIKNNFEDQNKSENLSFILFFSLILLSIISLIYIYNNQNLDDPFTEFFLAGPDGDISTIPINFKVDEEKFMMIKIINHENKLIKYKLEILYNDTYILQENQINLVDDQSSDITFSFIPNKKGNNQYLIFRLFKEEDKKIGELKLYLNVN